MFDFGIVVAKGIEEDAILRHLKNRKSVKHEQALMCTQGAARIPDGERVISFDSCVVNPEEIADRVRRKKKWVPTALLTMVLVLEYFGFPRQRIVQAFSPLADQLDLSA